MPTKNPTLFYGDKMESLTEIQKVLKEGKIVVPNYQRAYSWDTPKGKESRKTHTDVFISDLEEYIASGVDSPYYFGHFIFERDKNNEIFYIIDGQQRLTTIVMFLSALFIKLKELNNDKLQEDDQFLYYDLIKRGTGFYRFTTVDYDKEIFKEYIIDKIKENHYGLQTESAKRIVAAFDFFKKHLEYQDEQYTRKMLEAITKASCTTHSVSDESEAIQMFIFQNNRGKKPSNLEVIKAQFMYNVHLYGKEEKTEILDEIKNRFEYIYTSISSIESNLHEDDILTYTLRVYFNSLWEDNSLERINKMLSGDNSIKFIREFTYSLATSFKNLSVFFREDERNNMAAHSLITLGGISIAYPFVIKAYELGLNSNEKSQLFNSLESLVLRHRLIGTRADMRSRLQDVYKEFKKENKSIDSIVNLINTLKETNDWWWAYWNNAELIKSLQGGMDHPIAKFILWKYENYLIKVGKGGSVLRYDQIEKPELEHIAPTTEPSSKPHGYDEYTQEFRNQHIDCLGNYLLLTKKHNASIKNGQFFKKHQDYKWLEQQREVQNLVPDPHTGIWSKEIIQERKSKIIDFIMKNF